MGVVDLAAWVGIVCADCSDVDGPFVRGVRAWWCEACFYAGDELTTSRALHRRKATP